LEVGVIGGANIGTGEVGATQLASTAVTPGSYINTNVTFDADGRATAATSNVLPTNTIAYSGTGGAVTGLGTNLTYNVSQRRMGLNMNSPTDVLHINADNVSDGGITLERTTGIAGPFFKFRAQTGGYTGFFWNIAGSNRFGFLVSNGGPLVIQDYATGNAAMKFVSGLGWGVGSLSPTVTTLQGSKIAVEYSTGYVGINTSNASPTHQLDINSPNGIRLGRGTTAQRGVGTTSYLNWNTTTGAWDGHNGISFGRSYLSSDVTPGNGQVGVFNSTTGLYEPTTITLLSTAQTNYQIDVSENPAGTNFRTVYGGNSEAAIGVTQDGSDAAIVELSVYNSSSNAKSVITLDEGEASIEGAVARVKGTDAIVESRGITRLISTGAGFPIKQTYLTLLDTGAILVETTGLPNFAGVEYGANYANKFKPLSLITKSYADSLHSVGISGSITLPDGLVSILTSDGAGIEFDADRVNLVGTEVTVNGQLIPMNDTLVVPVYCHPHGEAAFTGNDYRGWRVPPDLDGARLIGVHYSFDTPGSDTALIQLGNGTVNVFGGTIPATGFVNVTASRVLVENEIWKPSIGTLNGTGHEGLMLNLIIERNR
jgi:hypothetical protein